jgi:hypothetical protein
MLVISININTAGTRYSFSDSGAMFQCELNHPTEVTLQISRVMPRTMIAQKAPENNVARPTIE